MLYSYMMTIMENTQFPGLALCGGHSKILARAPWHVLVDLWARSLHNPHASPIGFISFVCLSLYIYNHFWIATGIWFICFQIFRGIKTINQPGYQNVQSYQVDYPKNPCPGLVSYVCKCIEVPSPVMLSIDIVKGVLTTIKPSSVLISSQPVHANSP